MSIYRYPAASSVTEIRFRYANQRDPVALLTAQAHIGAQQVSAIRRAMEAQGWQAVPALVDGREVLQVTGFKEAGELAALLSAYQFTDDAPEITPEAGDHPSKTINEWAEHHSLKTAGWLNLIGDVGMLASGIHANDPYKITAGGLYTGGAAVLSRYANVKTEHQVQQVLDRTTDLLKQQAVQLPEDAGLFSIARDRKKGLIENTEAFLYRYPAEVMLTAYTMGALSMLRAGMKNGNPWDIAYGASSVGFKLASLLIPEKHKSDGPSASQDHGPIGAAMSWIQEKPLRLLGFGSLVSDVLLGMSAYRDFKNPVKRAGKSYIFTFLTTGAYLTADLLMAVSNKHTENADGKFSTDEQTRIEALAAETIARQPEAIRGGLILKVSRFLGSRPEMHGGAAGISRHIEAQVAQVAHNPWAQRVSVPAQAAASGLA